MNFFISPLYDTVYFIDFLILLFIFQNISEVKLSKTSQVKIAFILTGLQIIFNDFFYLIEPLVFLTIVFSLKNQWNRTQTIYYGLLPIVISDMFQRIISLYLRYLFQLDYSTLGLVFDFILTVSLIPFYKLFFSGLRIEPKYLKPDFRNHKLNSVFIGINIFFITYLLLVRGTAYLESLVQIGRITTEWDIYHTRTNILLVYFAIFTICLLYLNYVEKEQQEEEIRNLKDKELANLERYSRHIENLYKEIRGFRHDYTNILVSLHEAIKTEDIVSIRKIYDDVLKNSDRKFYDGQYELARLSNINNEAVKSLIHSKMLGAHEVGIDTSVEVDAEIEKPDIDLLDFITILSIFLDNAIESAEQCNKGSVVLAYFQETDRKMLIIENSTSEEIPNVTKLFEFGYSTKGKNRGVGLANVRNILSKYPKVSLATTSENQRFIQELTFFE